MTPAEAMEPSVSCLLPRERRGLVVVITGNGKGKTTAALGMVLRASGYGLRSVIVQFMKGDLYAGEWDGLRALGDRVRLHTTGRGFCGIGGNAVPRGEHRQAAQGALTLARRALLGGDCDLLVLDEINNAVKLGLVDLPQLLELLELRPPAVHLVLTGRDAAPELIERADTVSEVREVRHAFRRGIDPQPGIDY